MRKYFLLAWLLVAALIPAWAQNFNFNYYSTGKRVCLVSSEVHMQIPEVKVIFHDSLSNSVNTIEVYRRPAGTHAWTLVAGGIPPGTGHWPDTDVQTGECWEYQVKRENTWYFNSTDYDATGYTMGSLENDNSLFKGYMVLLVASDIPTSLPEKYSRLKKELTADGWYVLELIVQRATNWDSGNEVIAIRDQLVNFFMNAVEEAKPRVLFILGHVPLPRSGSQDVVAPDDHDQNRGARGCDAYYADIDGIYTDTATFNPGGLSSDLAINLPGDYRWDQDFFPSDIEMAFGRVDFADLADHITPEMTLMENYLDRLSLYKQMAPGWDMGSKSGFYYGYDNSNDGSYRSLPNISGPENVYQNLQGANPNEWVSLNGPMKLYMQNQMIPELSDWQNFGMNATVFSSDQSYYGFGDVPQPNGFYSRIRALLGYDTKCLVNLWTTMGINIFHQACSGLPLGLAMKDIMNHNSTNQYLEKPEQQYDTEDWWNRTHFAFYGDPTLSLYQVAPPSSLSMRELEGQALLEWNPSPDPEVLGYHVYQSNQEFGIFDRITNQPLASDSFIIPNYKFGDWYMVKAIKRITSGCGQFLHPSLGIDMEGDILLQNPELAESGLFIGPNPFQGTVQLTGTEAIQQVQVYSILGQELASFRIASQKQTNLDLSQLAEQVVVLHIRFDSGITLVQRLVKSGW